METPPIPEVEAIALGKELPKTPEEKKREKAEAILTLVEKINESGETLPFPGIHPDAYIKMKQADEEFPGYTTPTDEIIQRCEAVGIKIVVGNDPKSGNVYVLPADSDNIEMDSIVPRQLNADTITNEHLKKLVELTTKRAT